MTNFDFSQEEDQREYNPLGPVPSGSIVIVKMEIIPPEGDYVDYTNSLIKINNNGLRMLYCQFTVTKGSYEGVSWRQTITLPQGMQNINLSENYLTACRIGGSLLKSILVSTGKNLNVQDLRIFDGLTFPVKVKINKRSTEYEGQTYWKNEIANVILPDDERYRTIRQDIEYINEKGAVVGKEESKAKSYNNGSNYELPDSAYSRNKKIDEVPF